jgi:hypothetical protein
MFHTFTEMARAHNDGKGKGTQAIRPFRDDNEPHQMEIEIMQTKYGQPTWHTLLITLVTALMMLPAVVFAQDDQDEEEQVAGMLEEVIVTRRAEEKKTSRMYRLL